MHILIVEDDAAIRQELKQLLENALYQVTALDVFGDVAADIWKADPDIVLLDLNLPEESGFDICTKVRAVSEVPIIFLTSRTDSMDELTGMLKGGDDYITKPFRPRELIARIGAALRKNGRLGAVFEICGLFVDVAGGVVKKNGSEVFLSALEYRLLLVFVNNPRSIITRGRLLDELWDAAGEYVNDNTLTVYIKRLREKIEDDPANPQIILTVRGTGYRLGGAYASE